ncbi:MAG: argininosuccinate lyase, partial [Candidatus Lokiarchaeota archaeon]|nr:argininosuccinate lyase [Candidatus Lokiarchaeota archaeon]
MGKDIYRSVSNKPLNEDVLEFISSLKEDRWIWEEDIIGTEVHNIMLYEQDFLNDKEIKMILRSLENIKKRPIANELKTNKTFEDVHPFIEKAVIDEIGIKIGGKIHTGRSRNDQVSVDLRLKIRKELNLLSTNLFKFIDVIFELATKKLKVLMPLYTHLQRGQLGTFSQYLLNYIAQMLRNLNRVEELYNRINQNPLGACAIGGTSIKIDRQRTTELLGFQKIIENSVDAISSRDYIYETLCCLSIISLQLSRIAEDLILWSSKEFSFVELDEQFCSVSSVMPQKKNPDTLELIRSKSSRVISNLFTSSLIIKAIPSGYFRDFQELKMLLKRSFNLLNPKIKLLSGIFLTIKINENKMLQAINDSFILALDLAELLVQDYNIAFRNAHKIVANLVKSSDTTQDLFQKDRIENEIYKITGQKIELKQQFTDEFESLYTLLEKRGSRGAPSTKEMLRQMKIYKNERERLYLAFIKRIEELRASDKLRKEIIKKL